MLTCEDVGEGIATGDLQGWMLGPKDIEEERGETTQDAQETEGSNDPQQQYRLGIHAEICRARTKSSGPHILPKSYCWEELVSPTPRHPRPSTGESAEYGEGPASQLLLLLPASLQRRGTADGLPCASSPSSLSNKITLSAGLHFLVLAILC